MKTLRAALTVGQELKGLDLYATLKMDGKELQRFKCDSFVGNFPHLLNAMFHGGLRTIPLPQAPHYYDSNTYESPNVTGATNATPIAITVDQANWFDNMLPVEDYIFVWGVKGNTAANGWFKGKRTGEYTCELYTEDGSPVAGNGDYAGGGKIAVFGFREKWIRNQGSNGNFDDFLQYWQVIVGNGITPVGVNDQYLASRIQHGSGDGLLSHGNRSISTLTTDKPSCRFTISKSFTNNGTIDVVVTEIGIVSQGYNGTPFERVEYPGMLMVRDVLGASLTIPPGKTLTIDYELVIRLSPDTQDTELDGTNGGFLDDFMGAIRDMAIGGNNSQAALFNMAASSGHMGADGAHESYNSYSYGIRLGTDNTYVSMTDADCKAPILHGEGTGQLWHYGMNVEEVVRDDVANTAHFKVNRIVENRTAAPITIAEVSLFGNRRDSTVYDYGMNQPRIIARTALKSTDQITVNPGEFAMIEYTIEVIV